MRYSKRRNRRRRYIISKVDKINRKSSIESLPYELLTEVLARIAASSSTCLFYAKLSSKCFNEAADDDYVFQNMSVEKSPLISWRRSSNEIASNFFWERCKKSGNLEALFMQGVVDYFGLNRQEKSGMKLLQQAAKLGHNGARYILGIMLLLNEDDEINKQGIQIVGDIRKSNIKLSECRKRLEFLARRVWLRNPFHRRGIRYCTMREKHGPRSGWGGEDENDNIHCDACRCETEVVSFCGLFRNF